jgi:hypothetical protein
MNDGDSDERCNHSIKLGIFLSRSDYRFFKHNGTRAQ